MYRQRFARTLVGQEIRTVPEMGWAGIKNGELMALAASDFDIFITVDHNLSYQQNLKTFDIKLVVLRAPSNRFQDLQPFAEPILQRLSQLRSGTANIITSD